MKQQPRHFGIVTSSASIAISLAATAAAAAASAQQYDTAGGGARAGLINHVEGTVTVERQLVVLPPAELMFARQLGVREGKTLTTADNGRAELLLTPGITLRLGPEAAFTMLRSDPVDTRIRLVRGAAVVEVIERVKWDRVAVQLGESEVTFHKAGFYELATTPAGPAAHPQLLVYRGVAEAVRAGTSVTVKAGQVASFGPWLVSVQRLDRRQRDALLTWSIGRSQTMARANLTAAQVARTWGLGQRSSWIWNHYVGCYTYLPARYRHCDPFTDACYYSRYELPPIPPGHTQIHTPIPEQPEPPSPATFSFDANRGYTVGSGGRSAAGIPSTTNPNIEPVPDSGGGRNGMDAGGRGGEGGSRAK